MKEKFKVRIDLDLEIITEDEEATEDTPVEETPVAKITEEAVKAEKRRAARKAYKKTKEGKIRKASENAVYRATRKGYLIRPEVCSSCGNGSHEPLHAHHENYDPQNWLDVEWLCRSCHNKLHANKKEVNYV